MLVGINLLREGLDLPEVSLVAILDADKEGFLRSSTSLIQTIGRAARNVSGEVHMYADVLTDSMKLRHRRDQPPPREAGRLQPRERHRPARRCASRSPTSPTCSLREEADTAALLVRPRRDARSAPTPNLAARASPPRAATTSRRSSRDLNEQMLEAAGELKFELAARLRDEVSELKRSCARWRQAGHLRLIGPSIAAESTMRLQRAARRCQWPP